MDFIFKRNLPPGPVLPLPILAFLTGLSPLTLLESFASKYGGLFSVNLGHKNVIVLTNIDEIKRYFKFFPKRPNEVVNEWRNGM